MHETFIIQMLVKSMSREVGNLIEQGARGDIKESREHWSLILWEQDHCLDVGVINLLGPHTKE